MMFNAIFNNIDWYIYHDDELFGGRRSRDRVIVEFTTTYAIGTYHH